MVCVRASMKQGIVIIIIPLPVVHPPSKTGKNISAIKLFEILIASCCVMYMCMSLQRRKEAKQLNGWMEEREKDDKHVNYRAHFHPPLPSSFFLHLEKISEGKKERKKKKTKKIICKASSGKEKIRVVTTPEKFN